jgi:hypothetical protein
MDIEKARGEFHALWSSCVGQRKYNKHKWLELDLELDIACKTSDKKFLLEVVAQARYLQVCQLELN